MTFSTLPIKQISLNKEGLSRYTNASYPVRYGRYHLIRFEDFTAHCNLRGEVKYISGSTERWPHPLEWLKQSEGGDWIYYSTGNYYNGVFDLFGEYYFPCLSYRSNSLFKEDLFARKEVREALSRIASIAEFAANLSVSLPIGDCSFCCSAEASAQKLIGKKERLQNILKARIPVLPPDTRHVDYDVIPLIISDGCLYNCGFCEVKSGVAFSCRSHFEIDEQLRGLRGYLGPDLSNFNSLFLGNQDALAAKPEIILYAAEKAYSSLRLSESNMKGPRLFLFGSIDSFLEKDLDFFAALNELPYNCFLNLGLESFDQKTLDLLGKPIAAGKVDAAFQRATRISRVFSRLEISVNFLLGEALPEGHNFLLHKKLDETGKEGIGKTMVYLSPLIGSNKGSRLLHQFREIKKKSRFPTFLYHIQRFY